ncbi:hypothetical protein [Streptomyces sp. SLBN-31]|uniref:WD40 repeat domain-containing protein n=1 Tax=Streptomyces sp. SLBN-31 TaxID=2768444 RepID=UPI00114EB294
MPAGGSGDHTIRLWRVTASTSPAPIGHPVTGHHGAVYSVAFSPNGKLPASGSADQMIHLWKLTQ